jgi:hypothetical protein
MKIKRRSCRRKEGVAVCNHIFTWLTMLSVLEHQYGKRPEIDPFISTGALMSTLMSLTTPIGTPLFPLERITYDSLLQVWLTTGNC